MTKGICQKKFLIYSSRYTKSLSVFKQLNRNYIRSGIEPLLGMPTQGNKAKLKNYGVFFQIQYEYENFFIPLYQIFL